MERLRATRTCSSAMCVEASRGRARSCPRPTKAARGRSGSDLIRKMQEEKKRSCSTQVWARRNPDLPFRTPYELVTLASIVEKETGKADERPRVAGVFVNRLQKRMRLQSDPTIVYGLVGGGVRSARRSCGPKSTSADALQHLHNRRSPAGPDRQSRPRRAGGGGESVAHPGALFRRRRNGRACVRLVARRAFEERFALAAAREGKDRRRG